MLIRCLPLALSSSSLFSLLSSKKPNYRLTVTICYNLAMSEYIEIETEPSDDEEVMYFFTNLRLTDQAEESYGSVGEMEEGSAVANALAVVEGIETLKIEGGDLIVSKDADAEWHAIVLDITAVIKDFFL